MSLILAVDDVTPGMFAAIHSCWRPRAIIRRGQPIATETALESPAPVPPGVPLRVIGVSLPFAACAVVQPGGEEAGPVIVDLRAVRLSRLDPAFVDSIASFDPGHMTEADDE